MTDWFLNNQRIKYIGWLFSITNISKLTLMPKINCNLAGTLHALKYEKQSIKNGITFSGTLHSTTILGFQCAIFDDGSPNLFVPLNTPQYIQQAILEAINEDISPDGDSNDNASNFID
jgi:hypothetical protein